MPDSRFMTQSELFAVSGALAILMVIVLASRKLVRAKFHDLIPANKPAFPFANNTTAFAETLTRSPELPTSPPIEPQSNEPPTLPPVKIRKKYSREWLEGWLSLVAIIGDYFMILAGFVLAGLLCETGWVPAHLSSVTMPPLSQIAFLMLVSSGITLWSLTGRELYAFRSLTRSSKIRHRFVGRIGFCQLAFIGISQTVRTDPAVPWMFFVAAGAFALLLIYFWRLVLSRVVRWPVLASRLRRRLVVIGGGPQTLRIQQALVENPDMEFVGWVQANKPNHLTELDEFRLGGLHELGKILHENAANVAILTESESLQREGVLAVAKSCENEHVQFKMVPHFFEILLSGLRSESIADIQVLGVEALPLGGFRNQVVKRLVDVVGAVVGLMMAIPLIFIFGFIVYRESPGPVLYRQLRVGRGGRQFNIIKIRSMKMDAEAGGKAQWAKQNDDRRLKIGAFMRKWNIDEVPQFWNVLKGEMSLVGPRPERPELIARFKLKVPHYQSRHMCQPGITGWAQVNGWRGNTDLDTRIRHDIWYLENWSLWLDFIIMVKTFYRRENAY
jgi:exopolysaccharide biosynthesis polyprenyl glycosylphosphotransferase